MHRRKCVIIESTLQTWREVHPISFKVEYNLCIWSSNH
ncbi:hypothetical protein ZOSMA_265G00010 [Zostera marina]|uniref:Uncharacterized protein n=1 Tax=Zostera marina TaxID=29655 RepID=A0A0K9PEW0_ZOSMR|nr:hypothetical protein ZOSMA_265G00010 [Zostera marina]